MISRIRIETRGASMEEAERHADVVLGHARQAGFLEGIVTQSGRLTDHHFGLVIGERPDGWSNEGLVYEGRLTVTFDPERPPSGGLRQYGHRVLRDQSEVPEELQSGAGDVDVTGESIVLERVLPVTREHAWELGSPSDPAAPLTVGAGLLLDDAPRGVLTLDPVVRAELSGEEGMLLARLLAVPALSHLKVKSTPAGRHGSVTYYFELPQDAASERDGGPMGIGGAEDVYGGTTAEVLEAALAFMSSLRVSA